MQKPLTDTFLRAVRAPASGRIELADQSCRGLEWRITAAGARSWSYRYRAPVTGKLSRATIGPYPEVSLSEARTAANDLRKLVAAGGNPSEAKRQAKRDAPGRTFKALTDRYLIEYARRQKKSAGQDERNLKLHVLPKWADLDYGVIRRRDVIELIEAIIRDGKPVMANRVQSLVSSVFSFAIDSDLLDANPCARLRKRGAEKAVTRTLTEPEIRLFWAKVMLTPVSERVGLALRLALLTGTRPGEACGIRRSEVTRLDSADAAWTIPPSRTKNRKAHIVPLCPTAAGIVRRLAERPEGDKRNDYPLVPAMGKPDKSVTAHALARAMSRLAAKLEPDSAAARTWAAKPPTPHDLRRTFRTRLPQIGVPADIRDRLMNHIPTDVGSKHYDQHQYLAEKRDGLMAWEAALVAFIDGGAAGE